MQKSVPAFKKSRYNEDTVSKSGLAKKVGIGASAALVLTIAAFRMSQGGVPGLSFLEKGEMVYSGKTVAKLAGLKATETFLNVPMNWENAVLNLKKEIPSAIERNDGSEPYFVVPQMKDGRVRLSEFPQQSITVRPGRLVRAGARMMVQIDTGSNWSHVQIQDFRQPSALESAFNWLGDRLGI